MHAPSSFLSLRQVSKEYKGRFVLSDLSFDLAQGETVCLLGQSGSGKTTTLMLIAGLENLTQGEIWLEGEPQSSKDTFVPPEKRHMGFVFQDYALFPHLSVKKNVSFGIQGLPRAERQARVTQELSRLGMESYGDFYPHQLSGGEKQRVALARALAADPKILLLDEPFASLDRHWRERLREETRTLLRKRACPCIFVTHDPEEACTLADRIILLHKGKTIQQGTPETLYRHPNSLQTAQFFGKVHHFKARVKEGHLQLAPNWGLPLQTLAPQDSFQEGEELLVVMRAEAITPYAVAGGVPIGADKLEVSQVRFLGKMSEFSLKVKGADITLSAQGRSATQNDPPEFYLDRQGLHLFRV